MDSKMIGNRIKLTRELSQMTQEELARCIGCTPQHLGAIERGAKTPRLDTFITIANSMGVSADLLLQDVLEAPVDPMAGAMAAAVAPLSPQMQGRVLHALQILASDGDDAWSHSYISEER